MSINASYGWVALVMSNSSWGRKIWEAGGKGARKAKRPHLAGAAFSKTYAELSGSAASSDMAHPLIVAEATAEHFGALMGPSVDHGARQYMRMAGLVKRRLADHTPSVHGAGERCAPGNHYVSSAFVISERELARTERLTVRTKRGGTNQIVLSLVRHALFDRPRQHSRRVSAGHRGAAAVAGLCRLAEGTALGQRRLLLLARPILRSRSDCRRQSLARQVFAVHAVAGWLGCWRLVWRGSRP